MKTCTHCHEAEAEMKTFQGEDVCGPCLSESWKATADRLRNRTPSEVAAHGSTLNRKIANAFRTVGHGDNARRADEAAKAWEEKIR